MTAGDLRIPHARLIVVAAAIGVSAAVLALTRSYTFYFDDWDFILNSPAWSLTSYLEPHNGHPVMLAKLVYFVLLNTVGMTRYWPYMVLLVALHGLVVVLVFEVVRHRAGDGVGLAASALLVALGAGWENFLWAWEFAWLASVAAGLGAFMVLERPRSVRRNAIATALVVVSLMFSGIGVVFFAGVAVRLLVDADRRRDLVWLSPVAVAVIAWYLAFGRHGPQPNPPPGPGNIWLLPGYVAWGIGSSLAGLIGEGGWFGPPLLVAGIALVAWTWWRHRPDPLAVGVAAGLLALFGSAGLVRAQLGYEEAAASRYVYEGALLWIILLADAARRLPWRGTWRPALVACLFLACFSSATLLYSFAIAKAVQMDREAADLLALNAMRGNPCLTGDGSPDAFVMPQVTSPALYYRAVDRYGDPVAGRTVADRASYASAIAHLTRPGC